MAVLKFFFAHSKADDDATIDARAEELRRAAKALWHQNILVTLGREDYELHARRVGGWKYWPRDVVTRVDYDTGSPAYDGIIVPETTAGIIGKATAEIIVSAREVGRPVFLFGLDGTLRPFPALVVEDSENFKAGWRISG